MARLRVCGPSVPKQHTIDSIGSFVQYVDLLKNDIMNGSCVAQHDTQRAHFCRPVCKARSKEAVR